jgi:hypothetical protein
MWQNFSQGLFDKSLLSRYDWDKKDALRANHIVVVCITAAAEKSLWSFSSLVSQAVQI